MWKQLGEHVMAAQVKALDLLGTPALGMEQGSWYVFIDPLKVVDVTVGSICFGPRVRHVLRITCATQKDQEIVYLSCADWEQLSVLWKELGSKKEAPRRTRPIVPCPRAG